jgi:plastocyanin domain-containing protein
VPTAFTARAGVPTTLILRGKDSGGCARAFTIPELGVQEIAKRDGDTLIDLGTRKEGRLLFSCAMGMQGGAIEFKAGAARSGRAARPVTVIRTRTVGRSTVRLVEAAAAAPVKCRGGGAGSGALPAAVAGQSSGRCDRGRLVRLIRAGQEGVESL